MGGYLIDTGVANLLALRDQVTEERLRPLRPVYLPNIVFGELQFGAYWYAHRYQSTRYLDLYDAFAKRFRRNTLSCNFATASFYGAIFAELRSKGQPIQQNDVWIAALAIQYQLTLLSLDKDYERITGLKLLLFPR